MVRGTVGVVLVEDGAVVVVPGVFQSNGLWGVDVPDVCARDPVCEGVVVKDVVQRPGQPLIGVAGFVGSVGCCRIGVPGIGQDRHGVFTCVGVEVTSERYIGDGGTRFLRDGVERGGYPLGESGCLGDS